MPDTNNQGNERRFEVNAEEFVPFACYYNPHTILTKNGELLQIIKIVGFAAENVAHIGKEKLTLRRAVRKAVKESIPSDNFALWFHTLRRKKSLSAGGDYPDAFSKHLNKAWRSRHDWDNKYVNELYITVVYEGAAIEGESSGGLLSKILLKRQKQFQNQYLRHALKELDRATEKMMETLAIFGARRLRIFEHGGIFYSEHMRFFSKIINLKDYNYPVREMDLSTYLPVHKISFGFNALEVRGKEERHFAGIFSIKEYHEVSSKVIDAFLQLPFEFILSESLNFINSDRALEGFKYQEYILKLSEDEDFAEASGLKEIMASNTGKVTDFGEHQITVMVLGDSLKQLEGEIGRMQQELRELGILSVREDVMMEDCFWAQLPGNFNFFRRNSPINIDRAAGFASLYNFPAGKLKGNHWGAAVTIFYTAAGTPYFFNFHAEESGHTAIIGPFGAGKTVMLNFMLSEARKFNPKLFFFDQARGSEIFIRAIGGKYQIFEEGYKFLRVPRMNPLQLPHTEENEKFIAGWLEILVTEDDPLDEEEKAKLAEIVKHMLIVPEKERTLSGVAVFLDKMGMPIQRANLSKWLEGGEYAYLFNHREDELRLEHINGFGMTYLVREGLPLGPVLYYLMHRIKQSLDGTPAMIVLDEAWNLIDNNIFAPKLSEWLDELTKLNTVVIFATESVEDASKSRITKVITEKLSTRIFLPNQYATDAYRHVFGLSDIEFGLLKDMSKKERNFLLKHGDDAVVAELNLAGMDGIVAVLSAFPESLELMENIMDKVGSEVPREWLPEFIKTIKDKQGNEEN